MKTVSQSGTIPKDTRFTQYDTWRRRTGVLVGPGAYKEDE